MINKDTILSAFDDKGTLLKWLKKVEKALKESVLSNVEVIKITDTRAVIKFIFADNTTITTPEFTLTQLNIGEGLIIQDNNLVISTEGMKTLSINSTELIIGLELFECVYNGKYYKHLSLAKSFTGDDTIKTMFFRFTSTPASDVYINSISTSVFGFNGEALEANTQILDIIMKPFLLSNDTELVIEYNNE